MEEEGEGLVKLFRIIDIGLVFKIPFQKYKKNGETISIEDEEENEHSFYHQKKKKINFDPIQLNQTRGKKGDKTT